MTDISQLINAMRWGDIFQILEDPTDKADLIPAAEVARQPAEPAPPT